MKAKAVAKLLVTDIEHIAASVVGHGPLLMLSHSEIQQAFEEY